MLLTMLLIQPLLLLLLLLLLWVKVRLSVAGCRYVCDAVSCASTAASLRSYATFDPVNSSAEASNAAGYALQVPNDSSEAFMR